MLFTCANDYGANKYYFCGFTKLYIVINLMLMLLCIRQLIVYLKIRGIPVSDKRVWIISLALVSSLNNFLNYTFLNAFKGFIVIIFFLNTALYISICMYYLLSAQTFVKGYKKMLRRTNWALSIFNFLVVTIYSYSYAMGLENDKSNS